MIITIWLDGMRINAILLRKSKIIHFEEDEKKRKKIYKADVVFQ